MGKIVKIYQRCAAWLASWGADRYLHLLVGLIVAYVVGLVADGGGSWAGAAGLGVLAAVVLGFVKEVADSFATGEGDLGDIVFTAIGGAVAFGLLALGVWIG